MKVNKVLMKLILTYFSIAILGTQFTSLKVVDTVAAASESYLFDPNKFYTIREAEGEGRGYWVGAPSIFFDEETGIFWLTYRWRRGGPDKPQPNRGYKLCIAKSSDGINFEDVWSVTKDQLPGTYSFTRSPLLKDPNTGLFKLWIRRSAPNPAVFKLDDVADPKDFNITTAQQILGAGFGYPSIRWIENRYIMLYTYFDPKVEKQSLGSATSADGVDWTLNPHNPILEPGPGRWDRKSIVSGSIVSYPDSWLVLYTGFHEGYREADMWTGLAEWRPPPAWPYPKLTKLTVKDGYLQGPDPTWKTLWHVDSITVQGKTFFYYEAGTDDGSMDLRVSVVERARIKTTFSQTSANLGDIVKVVIELYMALPYTSVTIVTELPSELTYWGSFTDNLVPDATPTIDKNTITFTTNKSGEHTITFNVKVTKAYDHDETITNKIEATYKTPYYPYALLTSSANLTLKSFADSFDNSKTAGPDSTTINTSATWETTITINNLLYPFTMNVTVKENFGANLEVSILSCSGGTVTLYKNKPGNKYKLLWGVSVAAGETATLVLQMMTSGITSTGAKVLSSGACLKFRDADGTQLSAKTSPIIITVTP